MHFRLSQRAYSLDFKTPVRTAHGLWDRREGFVLRLEDGKGGCSYAELAPLEDFGTETVAEAGALLAKIGEDWDGRIPEALARTHPCTVGALRAALAGLGESEAEGKPEDFLAIAGLLPAGKAALERAPALAEFGFRVFKWKVGVGDLRDEQLLLDDLLALLPAGSKLRLDANGAWDRRAAERWLDHCVGRPIDYVEQPIAREARGSVDLLRGLAEDFPVTLALDESLVSDEDFGFWLSQGWPGVFVMKPLLLADAKSRCAELAERKARVVFSSALETAVGARFVLNLAFAWRGERLAQGLGVWPLFKDHRFDGPQHAPFVRRRDLGALNPDSVWNALN